MWHGRFTQDTSSLVQQFGESISYDWRLFPHDIAGSIAHARAHIAGYKCPKQVFFIGELPKNVSGKILKRELRDQFAG